MTMTILQVCQEALNEIGVDAPTTLEAGELGAQLLAISNTCGRLISRRHDWETLTVEGTFTTLATELQVTFASDFPYLRKIVPHTMWNRSKQRVVIGPLSRQAVQRVSSDNFTPSFPTYYIRASKLYFPGSPDAGEEVYFEYLDNRFATATDGTTLKTAFTLNTDTPRLDDYMMVLAVRWRFLQRKGLEYGEAFREFEDYMEERIGNDLPSETLNMNPRVSRDGGSSGEGDWHQVNGLTWDETTLTWG